MTSLTMNILTVVKALKASGFNDMSSLKKSLKLLQNYKTQVPPPK